MLETVDDNGFDLDVLQVYTPQNSCRQTEISRGAAALPETLPFGDQFFWTGSIDLTDMGATTLLPSYSEILISYWSLAYDATGNPFETQNNNMDRPICYVATSIARTEYFF